MITDDQLYSLAERFVLSFEKLAAAAEGLNEIQRRTFEKTFPERKEARDAILTRVPSEEDRLREAQGASGESLEEWLGELDEDQRKEDIGVREREWLKTKRGES